MRLNNLFSDLNLKKQDFAYILILLGLTTIISIMQTNYHMSIGFNSDVPVYLSNALYYAGLNSHNILPVHWLNNAPTLCFFTSILFRLGFVSPKSLYVVCSIFEILGIIGLYVFLKYRFEPVFSFLGCVFYISTFMYLQLASSGLTDLPAVSLSVWVLVFAILGFNKNPKYFIISSILLVMGFFIRPTVFFIFPVIALYFTYKHDIVKLLDDLLFDTQQFKNKIQSYLKSDEFKYIVLASLIFIFCFIGVLLIQFLIFNLYPGIFNEFNNSLAGFTNKHGTDLGYNSDRWYYFDVFYNILSYKKLNFIGVKWAEILFDLIIVGLILKIAEILSNLNFYKKIRNKNYYHFTKMNTILICLIFALFAVIIITLEKSYIMPITLIFISFVCFISILKQFNLDGNGMIFIVCLSWMIMYLIFISSINIKVIRYFAPILVPISYLMVLSIETILNTVHKLLNKNVNHKKAIFKFIPLILVIVLVCTTFFVLEINDGKSNYFKYDDIYSDSENTSNYLMKFDENYMDKNITTDHRARFYNWFLQRETNQIDTVYEPIESFDNSNSHYLLLNESVDFANYTEIYSHGNSHLYVNNSIDTSQL